MNIIFIAIFTSVISSPIMAMEQEGAGSTPRLVLKKRIATAKTSLIDQAVYQSQNPDHLCPAHCKPMENLKKDFKRIKKIAYKRFVELNKTSITKDKRIDSAKDNMKIVKLPEDAHKMLEALLCLMGVPTNYIIDEKDELPFIERCINIETDVLKCDLRKEFDLAYSHGLVQTVKLMVHKAPHLKECFKVCAPNIWGGVGVDVLDRHIAMLKYEEELQLLTPERIDDLEEWFGLAGSAYKYMEDYFKQLRDREKQ